MTDPAPSAAAMAEARRLFAAARAARDAGDHAEADRLRAEAGPHWCRAVHGPARAARMIEEAKSREAGR